MLVQIHFKFKLILLIVSICIHSSVLQSISLLFFLIILSIKLSLKHLSICLSSHPFQPPINLFVHPFIFKGWPLLEMSGRMLWSRLNRGRRCRLTGNSLTSWLKRLSAFGSTHTSSPVDLQMKLFLSSGMFHPLYRKQSLGWVALTLCSFILCKDLHCNGVIFSCWSVKCCNDLRKANRHFLFILKAQSPGELKSGSGV